LAGFQVSTDGRFWVSPEASRPVMPNGANGDLVNAIPGQLPSAGTQEPEPGSRKSRRTDAPIPVPKTSGRIVAASRCVLRGWGIVLARDALYAVHCGAYRHCARE